MCLTYLIIPCSGISFYDNTITSFAGTTFDCRYRSYLYLNYIKIISLAGATFAGEMAIETNLDPLVAVAEGLGECDLTYLRLPLSYVGLSSNQIKSLAGVTFAGTIR
jgi:hypothetical protein